MDNYQEFWLLVQQLGGDTPAADADVAVAQLHGFKDKLLNLLHMPVRSLYPGLWRAAPM